MPWLISPLDQREVNDLLSRKASWTENDVARFTALVRQDHTNDQREKDAKAAVTTADAGVETSITSLMRSILARYHEEQVWSDKIRSLSTYGSLAITAANVLIFLLALIFIEPYKRKRIVREVEARMTAREAQKDVSIQAQLADLQAIVASAVGGHLLQPSSLPVTSDSVDDSSSESESDSAQHMAGSVDTAMAESEEQLSPEPHLPSHIVSASETTPDASSHYTQRDMLYTSLTAAAAGCVVGGILQALLS